MRKSIPCKPINLRTAIHNAMRPERQLIAAAIDRDVARWMQQTAIAFQPKFTTQAALLSLP